MIKINLMATPPPLPPPSEDWNAYKRAWRKARRSDPAKVEQDRAYKRENYASRMADPVKREVSRTKERARYKTQREDPVKLEHQRKLARRRRGMLNAPPRPPGVQCAICHTRPGGHADHDHATGLFRGWLCGNCNTGLGLLKDDPNRMLDAMVYLLTSRAR